VPGRHTLGYEVYGQLSNVVILDVVGQGQSGGYSIGSEQYGQGQGSASGQEREFEVGPGESIQAAIDAANPGDTIWVKTGTYYDNLNINKPIYLGGWDTTKDPKISEDINPPILNAVGNDDAIVINADGVILESFKINDARNAGINVQSSNNKINLVDIKNNNYGLYLGPSAKNNTIIGSSFENNIYGVYLDSSAQNKINSIDFEGNHNGIYLKYSNDNLISYNSIYNSTQAGIYLFSSNNNKINMSDVWGNYDGIILSNSYSNKIIWNNFINSINNNAYDDGKNDWYDPLLKNFKGYMGSGNYYAYCSNGKSNCILWQGCIDSNDDEICDTSFNIPGGSNVDQYPASVCAGKCRTGAFGTKIKHHK
jgi:parallel beta-helix repeat protein